MEVAGAQVALQQVRAQKRELLEQLELLEEEHAALQGTTAQLAEQVAR